MAKFHLVEQDGTTIFLEVMVDSYILTIVTDVKLDEDSLTLYNFHMDGPGANRLGAGALRRLMHQLMEAYDVTQIQIEGFRRTTGAGPGRKPERLRFGRH